MEGECSHVIKEVGAPNVTEVPHPEELVVSSSSGDSSSSGSKSDAAAQEEGSEAVDPCESSGSYVFGPSTVMFSLGYFAEGTVREPGEEVVPEPAEDEVVVFKEFFIAGLRMPPPLALADILHKFQVQLDQLTPNAIAQLSKYFWAVLSFGGVPTSKGFMKCCDLHYQPKKVESDEGVMFQQFGCLNFHARRYQGGGVKLTLAIKNKWTSGWMKAWFHCKVSAHICPQGGKACMFCVRTCVAWTSGWSPLSTALTMTLDTPPSSWLTALLAIETQ
jgi:hypothetical protein